MTITRYLVAQICASLLLCFPATATNLVTGNGFGFAVVSPQTAMVSKFYVHPYSFVRPDPRNPLGEGLETANFIKSLDGATLPRTLSRQTMRKILMLSTLAAA